MRSRLVTTIVLVALGLTGSPASAQDGTPTTESDAASCASIEPRDAAFFQALAATPAATPAQQPTGQEDGAATPTPFAMPEGQPAESADIAEVTSLFQHLIACINAGDYLRVYALYGDEYLVRNLTADTIERLDATPAPTQESMQSEFGGVLDARQLEDGRIAALVTTRTAQSGDLLLFAVLRRDGERWLIDEERLVEAAAASPEDAPGTPSP
jgi:hypothetical protein